MLWNDTNWCQILDHSRCINLSVDVRLAPAPSLLAVLLKRRILRAVQLAVADLEQGLADLNERVHPALEDQLKLLKTFGYCGGFHSFTSRASASLPVFAERRA